MTPVPGRFIAPLKVKTPSGLYPLIRMQIVGFGDEAFTRMEEAHAALTKKPPTEGPRENCIQFVEAQLAKVNAFGFQP
jgi:hypothetical protein